jgi:hypothetical protein
VSNENELLPCPLCNGKAEVWGSGPFHIRCRKCSLKTALHYDFSPADTIAAWNTRRPTLSDEAVERAARDLIASRFETYRAGNGRQVSIQDDAGEKCWIVPFDAMHALETAITAAFSPPEYVAEAGTMVPVPTIAENATVAPVPSSLVPVEAVGWKLVPIEPTEAQILTQGKSRPDLAPNAKIASAAEALNVEVRRYAAEVYREMVAAAPAHREAGE